eukprot:CAMPEP_0116065650 /NCGR_PEP_ID=MMETSP0322-20121206/9904_1 /TAXON_ID=163516 /ORGANISM="Leptocylindrus danicus var. apora, Strain B651" /LENGTH=146 /DNA_ID=CAMNT_0003552035 /DNA_START=43 /DNA_END=483 /DNA_ORIENTATION=+
MTSRQGRRRDAHQQSIIRHASILRKNLMEWDYVLNTPARAENWPTMLGRLNAALNQANNLDNNIEDVLEHFCYLPKRVTANPGDIPLFLSSKLAPFPGMELSTKGDAAKRKVEDNEDMKEPVKKLREYESRVSSIVTKLESDIQRY